VGLWQIWVIALLAGGVEAFDQPARRALFPHLVDRSALMSAVALNSSIWPGTRIAAPAVAGFIIGFSQDQNPATAFYVAAAGFLVMVAVAYGLKLPRVTRANRGSPYQDLVEGLDFMRKNSIFGFLMAMTFFSSFFGNSYIMMMPIIAVKFLGVGASGQGLLMGVGAVGSLAVTVFFASRSKLSNKGMLIIVSGAMSGLSVAAFALTAQFFPNFILAMVLIVVVGVFNTGFTTLTQTSLQMMVPDQMRGRVMGFYGMTYNIRPLGGMLTGAMASVSFIGVPIAIAIGGVAVAAFAFGPGMANRTLRNLDALLSPRPEEARPATQGQPSSPTAAND
ncbi:MAG: MFS transporter, partial [Chloroflexi bacterium]|nr:MFS transporter [Chloroflexota bacterium]